MKVMSGVLSVMQKDTKVSQTGAFRKMYILKRLKFMLKNWKLGVHLIFRTKRFGVNNKRWSQFDSLFGASSFRERFSVRHNWKLMKHRAGACYFLGDEEYELLFGKLRGK